MITVILLHRTQFFKLVIWILRRCPMASLQTDWERRTNISIPLMDAFRSDSAGTRAATAQLLCYIGYHSESSAHLSS